ncbi:MAG TPA: PFL family protein, partial [Candidatus Omnitrophota bacterium]|nr:PFL family protein [Candidatus Omnitrophota bacterium]
PGKKPGDTVVLGGLLGIAPVMAVNRFSSGKFMARGGRFPAPVTGLTN